MAVVWRGANRYGAWAALVVTAVLAVGTEALGWSFPAQVALYLPAGFLSLIVVSLLTPSEPAETLDAFYTLLHTPVGHEDRLRAAGITIIHEGDSNTLDEVEHAVFSAPSAQSAPPADTTGTDSVTPKRVDGASTGRISDLPAQPDAREGSINDGETDLEADGHGLLVVDLLRLPETFSVRRYALDVKGFCASWGAVAGYLALALVLAWLAA